MKMVLLAGALVLSLGGCSGMVLPGGTSVNAHPTANAMRDCAMLADVLTPGVSPAAVMTLLRQAYSALGVDPQTAMRNCATIMDFIEDAGQTGE